MSTTIVATNKKQEGRSIIIKSNPVVGLLALTSLTDDASAPVGSKKFDKTFRYTTNGVQYSEWAPLTVDAISAVKADPLDPFIIEVAYFKDEPTGASVLDVNTVTVVGTNQAFQPTPFFDKTLFKKFFNSTDQGVLNWYVNVLEKLWNKGLIPNYMTRDEKDPKDFLDLWSAVSSFFAYYVTFARTFATFYNNYDILSDFLYQRGLTVSPEDTLGQLQTMLEEFYYQLTNRGTNHIWDESDGSAESITGEARRAVHYKMTDEFLHLLYRPEKFGWCLGNCSPLYKGLRANDNLNKLPWSKNANDMTNVTPYLTTGGTVVVDGGNKVAFLNNSAISVTSGIKVDHNLDYEISFQIKLFTGKFSLNVSGYDINGNVVSLKSRKTGSTVTSFFQNAVVSRTDKYVTVKCYLYNTSRGQFAADSTNIRQGSNIISPSTLQNIKFNLTVAGAARVFDFKMIPVQTDYSRGFLQSTNFISAWVKNRNNSFSTIQLEDYFNHYLVPYNSYVKIKNIGDLLYTTAEEDIDQTYWIGAGEYCRKVIWIGDDPSCEVINVMWVPEEETAYCEQA